MIEIPHEFRNVICPWQHNEHGQHERGVRGQIRFVEQMVKELTVEARRELLRLDQPDRMWQPHGK